MQRHCCHGRTEVSAMYHSNPQVSESMQYQCKICCSALLTRWTENALQLVFAMLCHATDHMIAQFKVFASFVPIHHHLKLLNRLSGNTLKLPKVLDYILPKVPGYMSNKHQDETQDDKGRPVTVSSQLSCRFSAHGLPPLPHLSIAELAKAWPPALARP